KVYLPTEVQIGDRLYYVTRIPPREPPSQPATRVAVRRKVTRQARSKAVAKAKPVEAAENRPAPRKFIPPPELKPDPIARQTLIQPDSPPDLRPPDPMLPSFQIWAVAPKLPKPFV